LIKSRTVSKQVCPVKAAHTSGGAEEYTSLEASDVGIPWLGSTLVSGEAASNSEVPSLVSAPLASAEPLVGAGAGVVEASGAAVATGSTFATAAPVEWAMGVERERPAKRFVSTSTDWYANNSSRSVPSSRTASPPSGEKESTLSTTRYAS
jgi:hypothetical protein